MSGERASLEAWLQRARAWADAQLERHFVPASRPLSADPEAGDARLAEAMRYAVLGEGKRLRPSLALLVCESLGGTSEAVELPAVAVELVHAYSLVHDDLPCMDDDDLRRGRPTCHVRFGEAPGGAGRRRALDARPSSSWRAGRTSSRWSGSACWRAPPATPAWWGARRST